MVGIDAFSQALTSPLIADLMFNESAFLAVWVAHDPQGITRVVRKQMPQFACALQPRELGLGHLF